MTDRRPGLRERKNERTQRAIIEATLRLTLEQGFETTTIAAIAEQAEVASRTVFAWFACKDDIVLGGLGEDVQRLQEALATGEGDVVDRIEAWLDAEGRFVRDVGELRRLRYRAVTTDPYLRSRARALWDDAEETIAAALARDLGQSADGIGPRAFAAAVMGVLVGLRRLYLTEPDPSEAAEQLEAGLAFLRGGVAALGHARDRAR
ncbi:MAG: transcriptional regulator, TetR family [Solirubrobacterales bacterium]|nr:transcriptional regulator, TetR family [Solirubrobacterales bacterium]